MIRGECSRLSRAGHKLLRGLAVGALISIGALSAEAQEAGRAPKASNIEITVGSGAGASPDIFVRRIGRILNESGLVETPIVVQNRTGGAWTVASKHVLAHPGDEGLLFGIVGTVFTTPIVQGLDTVYDKITPLALLSRIDLVIMVRQDSPIQNLKDFMEAAGKAPKALSMAGANLGSTDSIVAALINKAGGVELNYVPFDGGGGAVLTAFLGGTVDTIPLPLDEAYPLIQAGQARPIAILTADRHASEAFGNVPTAREQGYDIQWSQYFGLAAAPDLDPEVVKWWTGKLSAMVETDAWKESDKANFLSTDFVAGEKLEPTFKDLHARFVDVLTQLGLAKK